MKNSGYYKTNCPAGHTCFYFSTDYLNPEITYGEILDERDYQVYKTVKICDKDNANCQTWMAQNLNYNYNVKTAKSWCGGGSGTTEGDCSVYGRLYLWSAAMDSAAVFSDAGKGCGYGKTCSPSGTVRGVCPEGWHLPNDVEWNTLFTAVGGTSSAGTKLKSTSGWNSNGYGADCNGNGADSFGFSVLPAGYYHGDFDYFDYVGFNADFWSSSEFDSGHAYRMDFRYSSEGDVGVGSSKYYGFSVRCLRDSE